jgi:hypothetical protein
VGRTRALVPSSKLFSIGSEMLVLEAGLVVLWIVNPFVRNPHKAIDRSYVGTNLGRKKP